MMLDPLFPKGIRETFRDNLPNSLNIINLIRHNYGGSCFRPKDTDRTYRKVLENAIKDLDPDTKDNVVELLNSWQGLSSKEELSEILGRDKTEELLKNINLDEKIDLTDDERKRLRDILRDSLTFD
jgi:hypothetical protein